MGRTSPPRADIDHDTYKQWSPAAQQAALERVNEIRGSTYRRFYCKKPDCDGLPHDDWLWNHARADQHPPKGDWLTWLIKGGRGSGKTRSGAEFTRRMTEISPRIALVAPTGPDGRDIMVEGESGILATSPPGARPEWEPSKKRLTWPNGAQGQVFSAEEPDRLRGPQHHFAWVEEPAHMALIVDVWSNLLLGLRLGRQPRICATTTPRPTPWMKNLIADPSTVISQVATYANLGNLSPVFAAQVLAKYEGTRLGRQEIHGEILEDVEGALWNFDLIEPFRVEVAPQMERIVVGIDPAGSASAKSDETGIVVVGAITEGNNQHFYVLADGSGRMSPTAWATAAIHLHDHFDADAIVPERNYGGEMVTTTLRTVDSVARIIPVNSRRGKALRAEPILSLYEQGRVHHVGTFGDLEDQMVSWVPGVGDSPDRVDALVHAITNLSRGGGASSMASPTSLRYLRVVS